MKTLTIIKRSALLIFVVASFFNNLAEAKNNPANNKQVSEKVLAAISDKLSTELKAQLADDSATVRINEIGNLQKTKTAIKIDGAAFCTLADKSDNSLPLQFEAEINPKTDDLINVSYKFVEDAPQFTPATTEEFLMRELMKKIGKDYETNAIVLSIDNFESISETGGKEFLGTGEIKIRENEWSKIKFNVVLNDANEATKIVYSIE